MAVRLSADLGLHLDLNDQYRSGMLSQRDMDVRRTTFWGVFIHDKFVLSLFPSRCLHTNNLKHVESVCWATMGYKYQRHISLASTQGARRG
jgi:hypothetical protein